MVAGFSEVMLIITQALAGKPRINASSMTPSIPITRAKGSKNPEQCARSVASPTEMFAISQIIRPAGAATAMARPSTNKVSSKMERTMTFPICGFRYGGSSSVKEEGTPFNTVADKIFEIRSVMSTPSTMTPARIARGQNGGKCPGGTSHEKHGDDGNHGRETAIAWDKVVRNHGDQTFPRSVDDAAANDPGGIAAKAHAHGQCLFSAGGTALETPVQVKRNSWKITEVLQQRKQREKDCHWRQHN